MAATMPDDRLKTWFRAGRSVGCHWLGLGAPVLAELAADAGAETIVFDIQHGRWSSAGVQDAVAMVAGRAPCLARVADASYFSIGWALDAGVHGVIVPMISTPEQAADVVTSSRFPPLGRRSGGGARPMANFGDYRRATAEDLVVAVMIETVEGLEACEAIAATPGLDMVFIGPSDLSLALGTRQGSEVFEAALARILTAGRAAGVTVGVYTGAAQAAARAKQGFQLVVAADDISANRAIPAAAWKAFKEAVG
jgi:2-dehydro-3-deoxyglucarate aldolase/4-hydroxy-2-oxoheptanedioate aldolase